MLQDRGFDNVRALEGGIHTWQHEGSPTEGQHPGARTGPATSCEVTVR